MSCKVKPDKLPGKDGVLKDPILYQDLMAITNGNSKISSTIYYMIDDAFLSEYGGVLSYDEQGMPTLASLLKIDSVKRLIDLKTDAALKSLSKIFKTGTYTFKEAVERACDFNRNPSFKGNFLGIIYRNKEKGQDSYEFAIVEDTAQNRRNLKNTITAETFHNRIIAALAQAGVSVDFVDELENEVSGVYSNIAPERVFDTLYAAIKVVSSKDHNDAVLKEEAAHLIIGIAEGSESSKVLFKRLTEALKQVKPDSLKELFMSYGNYTSEAAERAVNEILAESDESMGREAAGRLVSLALNNYERLHITDISNNFIYKLVDRVANAVKSILRKIQRAFYVARKTPWKDSNTTTSFREMNAKDDIMHEARKLTERFLQNDLGSFEDSFGTLEERHHDSNIAAIAANGIVTAFNGFRKQMKNIGLTSKETRDLKQVVQDAVENGRTFRNIPELANFKRVASMLESINLMMHDFEDNIFAAINDTEFQEAMNSSDPYRITLLPNLDAKIKGISQMLTLFQLCNSVNSVLSEFLASNPELVEGFHIQELVDSINEVKNRLESGVTRANSKIFQATLSTVNCGHDYIVRMERMGWHGQRIEGRKYYFSELLSGESADSGDNESIVQDAGLWDTYMRSMGRSPWAINQLAANLYDYNKAEINKAMYRYSQRLLEWNEEIANKLGSDDTKFCCEVDRNGNITGNIVQPKYCYGEWERDFYDAKEQWKAEWKQHIKDYYEQNHKPLYATSQEEEVEWYKWIQPKYEAWHDKHSKRLTEENEDEKLFIQGFEDHGALTTKYLPGDEYKSNQWDNLSETQKDFVKEYVTIKRSLDEFLEAYHPNSVTSHRLPQFRGTFISRMRNKYYKEEVDEQTGQVKRTSVDSKVKRLGVDIHNKLTRDFMTDSVDSDFGDESCYNDEEESFFSMTSLTDREFFRRVPVYGVNRLKDMHNLSTDLAYSTMQYAAMALNVRGLVTTGLVLQNGLSVIKNTTVNGIKASTKTGTPSNLYARYCKFLEMQVFGQRSSLTLKGPTTKYGHQFVLEKALGLINRFSSWLLLSGKILSGPVNTGTGLVQLQKESFVGGHYTHEELVRAKAIYTKDAALRKVVGKDGKTVEKGISWKPLNAATKTDSFIRYFDAIDDNDAYFRNFEAHKRINKWSQLRTVDYGMWVYSSGNDFIQTIPYIAKAIHTKLYKLNAGVEETTENLLDKNNFTESGNVWDNFDETKLYRNGNISLIVDKDIKDAPKEETWGNVYESAEPYFIKNEDGSFVRWDRMAQSRFQTQCRYMTDNMHGIYNSADAVAFSQHWLGSAVLTMKKYMFGYIDKLYMSDRYSVAEGKDIEGAVSSWFKLMQYSLHNIKNNPKLFASVCSMGVPIILSATSGIMKCSTLGFAFDAMYMTMYPILFGKKRGVWNTLSDAKFTKSQQEGIRRFNAEMYAALLLRMVAQLLSPSFFAFGKPFKKADEDDDFEDDLSWGTKVDAKLLSLIGYDSYLDDLEDQVTDDYGNIKKAAKTPGLLYTYMKHNDVSPDAQYTLSLIYYMTHRMELEQATLFPYDFRVEYNNTMAEDIAYQAKQNANVAPVGMSVPINLASDAFLLASAGKPNYEYSEDTELYKDIIGDVWNEEDLAVMQKLIMTFRTGQYLTLKKIGLENNKGVDKMISLLPYINSFNSVYDPYEGAKNYDFGRGK